MSEYTDSKNQYNQYLSTMWSNKSVLSHNAIGSAAFSTTQVITPSHNVVDGGDILTIGPDFQQDESYPHSWYCQDCDHENVHYNELADNINRCEKCGQCREADVVWEDDVVNDYRESETQNKRILSLHAAVREARRWARRMKQERDEAIEALETMRAAKTGILFCAIHEVGYTGDTCPVCQRDAENDEVAPLIYGILKWTARPPRLVEWYERHQQRHYRTRARIDDYKEPDEEISSP